MGEFFAKLFDTADFPARWHCGRWSDGLGWLHIGSDLAIFVAYMTIPAVLLYSVARSDIGPRLGPQLKLTGLLFGGFIVLCGATHLIEAVLFWKPVYRFSGLAKLLTAGVSFATAAAMIWVAPRLVSLRSPAQLEQSVAEKTLELSLQVEANQRLASLVEQCADAIVCVDAKERVIAWNAAASQLFATPRDQALGRPACDILGGSISARCRTLLRVEGLSEPPLSGATWSRRGRELELELTLSAIQDSVGTVSGVSVIARDVTRQRAAERALETSESRFRGTFEHAPVGIAHVGLDGSWLRVNDRLCELLGYDREALSGLGVVELTHPDDLPKELDLKARALRGEIAGYELEKRYRHRSGAFIWGQLVVALVRDTPGEPPYFITATADITGLKRAKWDLEQQRFELENANKELEAFNYTVSHDLRAPVRAVSGFALMLEEDHGEALGAEGRRLVGVIRRNGERMAALIDDLLRFSRLGRQPVERGRVDMAEIAAASFAAARADSPDRAVELSLEALPQVSGDAALLRQVWVNLASNAMKYTRRRNPAVIRVWSETADDGVRFFVKDNGVGFDSRFVEKVFGVFERLHRENEFEGTGVGLAIVERILKRHGGSVSAEGTPGEGALFSFFLPRTAGDDARRAA